MKRAVLFIALVVSAVAAHAESVAELRAKLAALPQTDHSRAKGILLSELGTALYNDGQMAAAAVEFEHALEQPASHNLLKHVYLYLGKSYESDNRLDKAVQAYEKAIEYDPRNWKRYRDVANLFEQAQLYNKAVGYYEKAFTWNSKEPSLPFVLGRTWRKLGIYTEADKQLKLATDLGYPAIEIQAELSLVFEGQGHFGQALTASLASVGEKASPERLARIIYLAVLAGDGGVARKTLDQLKAQKPSPETTKFYENLVELTAAGPAALLTARDPNLQALIRGYIQ